MSKLTKLTAVAIPALLASYLSVAAQQTTTITSTNGTWTLYPALSESYQTEVNPPIAADGSSVFPAKRGVIPVSFSLFAGTGPVVFESIGSDGYQGYAGVGTGSDYADDYSYLDFAPKTSFTFAQITNLTATYSNFTGNCHGGSLRWSIEFANGGHIYIYYGNDESKNPIGTDCTTPGQATNQSGLSMINAAYDEAADTRYETGANPGVYVNYSDAAAYAANQGAVTDITLVVDSGWQTPWTDYNGVIHNSGDQSLTLTNAQIQTSLPTTDTFTPPSSTPTHTCTLPTARIQVTKTSGSNSGIVNDVLSVSAADTTGYFRVVDCKYMYNLDVSTLSGAGTYSVAALINGTPALNPATFQLK